MKRLTGILAVVFALVVLTGCTATKSQQGADTAPSATIQSANIFIEGKYRTITPAIIRVFREGRSKTVALRDANGNRMRLYELEFTPASHAASEVAYSFWGNSNAGVAQFDTQNLPKTDSSFVVPFYNRVVQIDDRDFGLTMLIEP